MSTTRPETDIARKHYEAIHEYAELKKSDWPNEERKVNDARNEFMRNKNNLKMFLIDKDGLPVEAQAWRNALANAEKYAKHMDAHPEADSQDFLSLLHLSHNAKADRDKFLHQQNQLLVEQDWIFITKRIEISKQNFWQIKNNDDVSQEVKKSMLNVWKNSIDDLDKFYLKKSKEDAGKLGLILEPLKQIENHRQYYLAEKEFQNKHSPSFISSGFSLCCCWNVSQNDEKDQNNQDVPSPSYQGM